MAMADMPGDDSGHMNHTMAESDPPCVSQDCDNCIEAPEALSVKFESNKPLDVVSPDIDHDDWNHHSNDRTPVATANATLLAQSKQPNRSRWDHTPVHLKDLLLE